MRSAFIDPAKAEQLLAAVLDEMDAQPSRFTDWEQAFLESLEDHMEEHTISEEQWKKLNQIHDQRMI